MTATALIPLPLLFRFLRKTSLISRFTGIFFLLLFTLSVTPKRFLHDALAHHKDSEHAVSGDAQGYYASGFQCHADDLVVEAPFLPEPANPFFVVLSFVPVEYASPLYLRLARPVFVSGVRGPPVAAVS